MIFRFEFKPQKDAFDVQDVIPVGSIIGFTIAEWEGNEWETNPREFSGENRNHLTITRIDPPVKFGKDFNETDAIFIHGPTMNKLVAEWVKTPAWLSYVSSQVRKHPMVKPNFSRLKELPTGPRPLQVGPAAPIAKQEKPPKKKSGPKPPSAYFVKQTENIHIWKHLLKILIVQSFKEPLSTWTIAHLSGLAPNSVGARFGGLGTFLTLTFGHEPEQCWRMIRVHGAYRTTFQALEFAKEAYWDLLAEIKKREKLIDSFPEVKDLYHPKTKFPKPPKEIPPLPRAASAPSSAAIVIPGTPPPPSTAKESVKDEKPKYRTKILVEIERLGLFLEILLYIQNHSGTNGVTDFYIAQALKTHSTIIGPAIRSLRVWLKNNLHMEFGECIRITENPHTYFPGKKLILVYNSMKETRDLKAKSEET